MNTQSRAVRVDKVTSCWFIHFIARTSFTGHHFLADRVDHVSFLQDGLLLPLLVLPRLQQRAVLGVAGGDDSVHHLARYADGRWVIRDQRWSKDSRQMLKPAAH
jgi:hypothetical protein